MTRKTLILAALFALATLLHAQVSLSIQFYDKRLYVPGSEIPVRVTIRNESPHTYRFKLADERRLSVAFDVRTLGNRALPPSDSWKRTMATNVPRYYRELALQPGEEYSFLEDLSAYAAIADAGTYIVRCSFYAELIPPSNLGGLAAGSVLVNGGQSAVGGPAPLASNALTLAVRPASPTPGIAETFRAGAAEVLKAERVAPDEVVARTIRARQRSRWNEFYLYLDIEALLRRNADKRRAYDRESDDGRRRMIEAFKADLMAGVVDQDIVVIPSFFEIVETRYGSSRGTVRTVQKFDYPDFRMIKEYTYELEKRDDIWYIVSYTVENKGTE